jgi:hypothetical protein
VDDFLISEVLETLEYLSDDMFEEEGFEDWSSIVVGFHVFVQVNGETLEDDNNMLSESKAVHVLHYPITPFQVLLSFRLIHISSFLQLL